RNLRAPSADPLSRRRRAARNSAPAADRCTLRTSEHSIDVQLRTSEHSIDVETYERHLQIRFRVDGVLREILRPQPIDVRYVR
ncbi:hypothetical protein C7D73_30415, partial [Klebsiella pneumoniae]